MKSKYIQLTIYFLILLFCVNYLINTVDYLDITSLCYIRIDDDMLRGNFSTIAKAIKYLKKSDKASYTTLCRNVDKISENYCYGSDWHLDNDWQANAQNKNCFIRGSHTIYLWPEQSDSENIVLSRAEAIKKYAQYSQDFWNHLP